MGPLATRIWRKRRHFFTGELFHALCEVLGCVRRVTAHCGGSDGRRDGSRIMGEHHPGSEPNPEVGTTGTVQRSVRVLRRAWDDRCARLTLYRSEGAGSSRTRFEKGLRRARGCTTWTIPPQYLLALHGRSGIRLYSGGEFAVPGTRGCES